MHWMQVAIRPARPFAFGTLGGPGGTPVFGLPGNPVSALVSYEMFVRPALRKIGGHRRLGRPRVSARADVAITRAQDGKLHLVRVAARFGDDGRVHVRPSGLQESHLLRAMAGANALALVPDGDGIAAGEDVDVLLIDPEEMGSPG
jgi:molybdopterin biosynthesis enzyme